MLARDNPDSRCSPCERQRLLGSIDGSSRIGRRPGDVSYAALQTAWGEGLPALAAAAATDLPGAARLAWQLGLVPRRWRLGRAELDSLATATDVSNTELAARLGVSRWAVASWRERLGLRRARRSQPRRASGDLAAVRLVVGPRCELVGPSGAHRLGAATAQLLAVLAERHPAPVPAEELAAAMPDADRGRRAVHSAVWRLRQSLPDGVVISCSGGYRLGLAADQITRS